MLEKKWTGDYNDRLYILLPKGAKAGLKAHVAKRREDGNISAYIKTLIEMDLSGQIEWGEENESFPLLYKMAAAEKK